MFVQAEQPGPDERPFGEIEATAGLLDGDGPGVFGAIFSGNVPQVVAVQADGQRGRNHLHRDALHRREHGSQRLVAPSTISFSARSSSSTRSGPSSRKRTAMLYAGFPGSSWSRYQKPCLPDRRRENEDLVRDGLVAWPFWPAVSRVLGASHRGRSLSVRLFRRPSRESLHAIAIPRNGDELRAFESRAVGVRLVRGPPAIAVMVRPDRTCFGVTFMPASFARAMIWNT